MKILYTSISQKENSSEAKSKNEKGAVNFLQLANGNFMVKKTTFHLSPRVSEQLSVQSFQNKSSCKGTLWIDSGTKVITMWRRFKMIEYTNRRVDMTGF